MTTNQTAHSEHNDPTPTYSDLISDGGLDPRNEPTEDSTSAPDASTPTPLTEALAIIRHILATTPAKPKD